MQFLGVFQFLLAFYILFYEYKRGSLSIFLWGPLLMMFGIPHMITSFVSEREFPDWVINYASLFAIVSEALYLFTMLVLNQKNGRFDLVKSLRLTRNSRIEGVQLGWTFMFFMALSPYLIMTHISRVAGSVMDSSWGQLLGSATDMYDMSFSVSYFYNFTSYFISFSCCMILIFMFQKRMILFCLTSLTVIAEVIAIREKQRILPLVIPVFIYIYIRNRKLTLKSALRYLIVVSVGFAAVMVLAIMRDGSLQYFLSHNNPSIIAAKMADMLINSKGELGLRRYFYTFIERHNHFKGFNSGATYKRLLLMFLPTRWSFGLKPGDFAVTMANALLGVEQTRASAHPTFFGDSYANFNVFGVFTGALWAVIAHFLEKMIVRRKNYYVRCGMAMSICNMYIMVARGSVYNSVYRYVFSCIFLYVVYHVVGAFFGRKRIRLSFSTAQG